MTVIELISVGKAKLVMSPRQRKFLSPKSTDFGVRFAIHLRKLLDERGLKPLDFIRKMQDARADVTPGGIRKWLAGDRLPRPQDAEGIARILGLNDYRDIWPPPI